MFKDLYKAANDDIRAGDELLAKVLGQKRRKTRGVLKYSTIAAACAVIAVSITAAPMLFNKSVPDGVHEQSIAVSPDPDKNASQITPALSAPDSAAEQDSGQSGDTTRKQTDNKEKTEKSAESERAVQARPDGAVKQTEKTASKDRSPKGGSESRINSEDASYSAEKAEDKKDDKGEENTSSEVSESTDEASVITDAKEDRRVNTYTKSVVLCVNSENYGAAYSDAADIYGIYSEDGGYEAAEWNMDDYFSYLGENVFDKLLLPGDFSYAGDYEMNVSLNDNGEPVLDSEIFPYEGADGRYVTVITSRNTLSARSYLEDTRYKKSDIEGTAAVVIGGGNYKCYMIARGISYTVTAYGVTEDELTDLLISIGG